MCDGDHLWSRMPDGELALKPLRALIAQDRE